MSEKEKKEIRKGFTFVFIVIFAFVWVFSGWPQITFHHGDTSFKFPPSVETAYAVDTIIVISLVASSTWEVPSDFNAASNTIEVIGGGGGGGTATSGGGSDEGHGGGGGAYAKITNFNPGASSTVPIQIGAGGTGGSGAGGKGDNASSTWFDGGAVTCSDQSVCAAGGDGGDGGGGTGGGAGGDDSTLGSASSTGGAGETHGATIGGAGGGAGGPGGNGNAGSSGTGGQGGGTGGGTGGTAGKPGNPGNAGTDLYGGTAGSGGGGGAGSGSAAAGGAGGAYGGGGGGGDTNAGAGAAGDDGVIVIGYTPVAVTILTQNDFRIYVDNDALDPTDPWGNPDLAENEALSAVPPSNDPIDPNDEVRIRMSIVVTVATLGASAEGFILQFGQGDDCTAITSWTDVAANGGGGPWEFALSSVTDNTALGADPPLAGELNLGVSDVAGRYNKSDPTTTNPFEVLAGEDLEWDWHIIYTGSAGAATYCFRMRKDAPADLDGYNDYPKVDIRPNTSNQLRHGNFFTEGVERGFFWAN